MDDGALPPTELLAEARRADAGAAGVGAPSLPPPHDLPRAVEP